MNKKLIWILVLILLISNVSAWDWDNGGTYNEDTKTMTIKNGCILGICLGNVIANITLLSDLNVKVIVGEDRKIAEFEINNYGNSYDNALKEMELFNTRDMSIMNEEFTYKYRTTIETKQIPIYEESCNEVGEYENKTKKIVCVSEIIGYRPKEIYQWEKLEQEKILSLPKGKHIIGIFKDVSRREQGEWIPTLFGVRIDEWAEWTEGLNLGLVSYWTLNESTGKLIDSLQINNGTISGTATQGVIGKINNSVLFDGNSGEGAVLIEDDATLENYNFTISFWTKYDDTKDSGSSPIIIVKSDAVHFYVNAGGSPTPTFQIFQSDTTQIQVALTGHIITGLWTFYTVTTNSTDVVVYINGTEINNNQYDGTIIDNGNDWEFGKLGADLYGGNLDEVGYWNRSLSPTEITNLYNEGNGITYTTSFNLAPVIELQAPNNNSYQEIQATDFKYNVSDDGSLNNCSLWLEKANVWEMNKSDDSITEIINQTLAISLKYDENLNWSIACYDDEGLQGNSTKFNYSVYTPTIQVNQIYPANNTNFSITEINLTYTTTLIVGSVDSCRLWLDGEINSTDYSITPTVNQYFNKSFADGSYLWSVECNDTFDNKGNSSTRNFIIDTVPPTLSLLTHPLTRRGFYSLPNNVTLNYSATDSLALNSCWYNTSESATMNIFTCNEATNVSFSNEGNKTIWYYANDSSNNEVYNTTYVYVYNVTATVTESTDPISEGIQNIITLIVSAQDIPDTIASLIWNFTDYGQGTRIKTSDSTYTFTNTFVIPFETGNSTGARIPYNYSYNISTFFEGNVSGNQTVHDVSVDNCSINTKTLINYTLRDEEAQTLLIGNIETAVNLISRENNSISWTYNNSFINVTSIRVCIPDLYGEYDLDVITLYSAIDNFSYVSEYHYFDNFNLTNSTSAQLINLYDLNASDSTTFLITYRDEYYLPVEDAIIDILRFYVSDNAFKSVEMGQVDNAGQTRGHLVTEDIIYMFIARLRNSIIYTSPKYFALCQTAPCQINLFKDQEIELNYSYYDNLIYTMTTNESTRQVTVIFLSEDGSSIDVSLNVTQNSPYNNASVCFDSNMASSGTLSCLIPTTYDNMTYIANFEKDSSFVDRDYIDFKPDQSIYFGGTGIILAVFLILTLGMMALSSGFMVILSVIAGVVFAGMLVLINTGSLFGVTSGLMWLMVAGVIIIIKIAKRRIA